MSDKRRRTDILFNTGGAIAPKHPGGRPKTYDEPRVKVSLLIRKSQLRALEAIRNAERLRLDSRTVSVTSLIGQAIDQYLAKHK